MPDAVAMLLVPLLIAINAFFVAAEYALVAIRPTQVDALRVERESRAVRTLAYLVNRPGTALAAIQVCITMANLMLGWIGEPAVSGAIEWMLGPMTAVIPPRVFHVVSFVIGFVVVTLLTVVLSELVPKAVTIRHARSVAVIVAIPVFWVMHVVQPLTWLMNKAANAIIRPLGLGRVEEIEKQSYTAEEIRLIATEAAADGVLTSAERSLILNTLSLGKRAARQIMVSRVHVDFFDLKRSIRENIEVLERHLHSRLPLCDGGMDKVFGVVTTKELLWAWEGEHDTDSSVLQLLAKPAVFVPETLTVDKLLPLFYQHQTQMLFLVSEYGGVEGIVTLKDVIDEILRDSGNDATEAPPKHSQA